MPEPTPSKTYDDESAALIQPDCSAEHTCACGEQHRHRAGTARHRESCTSPLKYGDSCCCGTDPGKAGDRHRCGYDRLCE